jgi:hypothetical protein
MAITAGTAKHRALQSGCGWMSDYYHQQKQKRKGKKRQRKEEESTVPGTAKHGAVRSGCGRMKSVIQFLPLTLFQVKPEIHVTEMRRVKCIGQVM